MEEQEQVSGYLSTLDLNSKAIIEYLRGVILSVNPLISDRIKWNSLSYYYTGEMKAFDPKEYKRDIVVCNLHRGKLLLVFPTGAEVKDSINGKNYPDGRKIITLTDLSDVIAKEKAVVQIVIDWLALIEK